MGIWICGIIVLFLLGTILNFRTSPKDKALAILRENARKRGLNPRLVPAPDWLGVEKTGRYATMVACYSLILPDAKLPLMRALVEQQQLQVLVGDERYQHYPVELQRVYGVELQANSVSIYWQEIGDGKSLKQVDIDQQLNELNAFLVELSTF